jgi:hypothetical protein
MLLDAAHSFPTRPEDRLTELVATTAEACPSFAAQLLGSLGLPVGDAFAVETQVHVHGVGKPDLVIRSYNGGAWLGQLWFEHKLRARDQPHQVARYLKHLRDASVPGELYYVVDDVKRAREQGAAHGITWQQLAEMADAAGRNGYGTDWRDRALGSDSPARWRLLAELVWYLNDKDLAVLDALDTRQVNAIAYATQAFTTLDKLMESAAKRTGFNPVGGGEYEDDGYSVWEDFEMPEGSNWLHRFEPLEGAVELCLSDRDRWSRARHDEPCFGAGFTVDGAVYDELSVRHDWVAALEDEGFCVTLWEDTVVMYRTKRMAEFVSEGTTLPAQAAALGQWAREAFIDLGREVHDPGHVTVPADEA